MNAQALTGYSLRVESRIGGGGGGTVYKAWHMRLEKYVVIKECRLSCSPPARRNEADALKNIKNQYLPQIYDYLEESGCAVTVMEYIEGRSFDKLLRLGQMFSESEVIKWYLQLALALEALHGQNICHRDIKPANIMLKPDGDVCLIDFDTAYVNGSTAKVISRSLGYASPEQYEIYEQIKKSRGVQKSASPHSVERIDWKRSDIYSLGAAVYHILTGRHPHKRTKEAAAASKPGRYGTDLMGIITKSMQAEPSKRFASAADLARSIGGISKRGEKGVIKLSPGEMILCGITAGLSGAAILATIRACR